MHDQIEWLGGRTFAVLQAMLRPAVRADALQPDPLMPALSGDITVDCSGSRSEMVVDQVLQNPNPQRLHLTTTFPLPPAARLRALDFGTIRASTVERHAARRLFDAERVAGRVAVVVNEESPGIFTQEIGCMAPQQPIRVRLRFSFGLPAAACGPPLRVTLRFDSSTPISRREQITAVLEEAEFVRLGRGRLLDSFLALLPPATPLAAPAGARARIPRDSLVRGTFASCETGGGACGVFHGRLAGRPVRLILDLRRTGERSEEDSPATRVIERPRSAPANTAMVAVSEELPSATASWPKRDPSGLHATPQ